MDPMSFRPIALTNTICKLIERMIKERLMWILEDRKLLSENSSDILLILERATSEGYANGRHTLVAFLCEKGL
jgi:hypothetical protein